MNLAFSEAVAAVTRRSSLGHASSHDTDSFAESERAKLELWNAAKCETWHKACVSGLQTFRMLYSCPSISVYGYIVALEDEKMFL